MEFTTNFVVNCIKTRCKFMYFFDRFGTLQNLAETLKHRWLPSQMRLPRWKSRCKFHLFLVVFRSHFLQRKLMEFTTDFDGIYNGFGLLPGKTVDFDVVPFCRKIALFWFFDHFCSNPVVNVVFSSKSRCKKWLCQNAETSVAAEPFEWAGNAKIQKIDRKKQNFMKKQHFFV